MYTESEIKLYVKRVILNDVIPLSDIVVDVNNDCNYFTWKRLFGYEYKDKTRSYSDPLPSNGKGSFRSISDSGFDKFLIISKRSLYINSMLRNIEES